jgi:uncharacterized membrane protein
MAVDPQTLLAILGMACVTYATRAGGFWLMSRVTLSRRVEAWLRHIPGAVLISIIAPTVITGGSAEAGAALVTALIALRTGSLPLAMAAGVSAVWVLRTWTPL